MTPIWAVSTDFVLSPPFRFLSKTLDEQRRICYRKLAPAEEPMAKSRARLCLDGSGVSMRETNKISLRSLCIGYEVDSHKSSMLRKKSPAYWDDLYGSKIQN